MGAIAGIVYFMVKHKKSKNVVVKELSFPTQLPYAEDEEEPTAKV